MRVNTKPRHRNSGRPASKSAPGFLQWLRGRPCAVCGAVESIEAAHVDYAGDKGMATKVSDRFAVAMCAADHRSQHMFGWSDFEARHNFDALAAAEAFWRAWPGRLAWERKQETNDG